MALCLFTTVRSMGVDMKWMLHCDVESSVTSSTLRPTFPWHTHDRASATGIDLPFLDMDIKSQASKE